MRVLFIGCVLSSEVFLKKVFQMNVEIVGVITKKESSFNTDFVDLGAFCKKNQIDFIYSENINNNICLKYIEKKQPDIIFCFGWSELIGNRILRIPKLGVVGFHPTDLPCNRGRHPIIWALVLGLEETASTFFLMNEKADAGTILSKRKICITYEDDAQTLYNKILSEGCIQIEEIINGLENNNLCPIEQNLEEGNVWRRRCKQDGEIDWRMSKNSIYNLVRALTKPYGGAHFRWKESEYRVWKVLELSSDGYKNIEYGKVIKVMSDTHFIVKVSDGLLEILDCDPVNLKEGIYL